MNIVSQPAKLVKTGLYWEMKDDMVVHNNEYTN